MSIARAVTALFIVLALVVVGGSIYVPSHAPRDPRDDVTTRAGTWLRGALHLPVRARPAELHVTTTAAQERVFALARDPSVWVRSLAHLERDPDVDITTTGTPGEVGYVFAWSSTSSILVFERGSIAVTSVQPPIRVGLHVTLAGAVAGDVVIRTSEASSRTAIDVTVDVPRGPKAADVAGSTAELIAYAVRDAVEPRAAPEAAASPDLGVVRRPHVSWQLESCKNAPGCVQNAFSRTCAEAGMKTVRVVVTDERAHKKVVTHAPCPASATEGDVAIDVPPGAGPFTIAASSDEVATARSGLVCHVTPRCWERGISLNLYALGCNDPECTACIDAGHAPGWCE